MKSLISSLTLSKLHLDQCPMPYYTAAGYKKSTLPNEPASRSKELTKECLNDAMLALNSIMPLKNSADFPMTSEIIAKAFDIVNNVYAETNRIQQYKQK